MTRASTSPAQSRRGAGGSPKQGSPAARWALVEAAWSVVRQPGPLHAFYERIRARRGSKVAVVASARKLAVLFWCLLARDEDYAHQQPSLTQKKLRLLEIRAGAPTLAGTNTGTWAQRQRMRAERELAQQAEAPYARMVSDWQATAKGRAGASVTPGRASGPSEGKAARQAESPWRLRFATRLRLIGGYSVVHFRFPKVVHLSVPLDSPRARKPGRPGRVHGDRPKTAPQEKICGPPPSPRDRSGGRNNANSVRNRRRDP